MKHNSLLQQCELGQIRRIHFIGVAGVGMSGIAMVLANQGFQVTGSDCRASQTRVAQLIEAGIQVYTDHAASHLEGVDVVVVSSAIPKAHIEYQAALNAGIPMLKRAEMLSELMRFHRGIAISGTHGKTTTTSLVASVFEHAGKDPTYVIGGHVKCNMGQVRVGQQDYFIAEADESDASFLYLRPVIAVITSIDADHLDTYQGSLDQLKSAFVQFAHQLPFYGHLVLCLDDPHAAALKSRIQRPCITYGRHCDAEYRLISTQVVGLTTQFVVQAPDQSCHTLCLNGPGVHQVSNAMAALVVARTCHIEWDVIATALKAFPGVKRRFDVLGTYDWSSAQTGISIVDDYGHHPSAVRVTLEAARAVWSSRRIVLCFEPHRYSRLKDLFNEFVEALSDADQLILMPVYACGESPQAGYEGHALQQALQSRCDQTVHNATDLNQLETLLTTVLKSDDILICQGAGALSQHIRALVSHRCPVMLEDI
ncbi:MAG: UDP-N-acetylmuramate--L-alanine ligase [Legionellales bacterium]|nr:UDP-N-acetylmuramate--L-alanine ligase [Legionellales bacterium]